MTPDTLQTDAPCEYGTLRGLVDAAMAELGHYKHRADVPPDISTADSNIVRCEDHLLELESRLSSDADPDEYSNPLQVDLRSISIGMRTYPDWMVVTEIEIDTENGDVLAHWEVRHGRA